MKLEEVQILRKYVIPMLSKINLGNIRITHHYTGDKILIHSFRHKGYWYHGKKREYDTMISFQKLLYRGDTVIEIGGHIGYITLWLSRLVGPEGHVHVFEPGHNNLPYIRHNIREKSNVSLIEKGAGSKEEVLTFYLDNLTGQNNSFIENHEAFESAKANAYVKNANLHHVKVNVIPVDDYVNHQNISTAFIKIDVESYECEVIKGLIKTLKNQKPIMMVEIAPENTDWVYQTMHSLDYIGYSQTLKKLSNHQHGNIFFIHSSKSQLL